MMEFTRKELQTLAARVHDLASVIVNDPILFRILIRLGDAADELDAYMAREDFETAKTDAKPTDSGYEMARRILAARREGE